MCKIKIIKNIGLGIFSGLLVLVFSWLASNLLYHTKKEVKRGYEVTIAEKTAEEKIDGIKSGNLSDLSVKSKKVTETAKGDIEAMIKNANLDAGAKVFKKCATCHSAEKMGGNKIGPNLFGVVGRKRAAIANFAYSDAMKKKSGSWTHADLNQFLIKPKDFIPGTKMGFAGLSKEQDRANIIAYLEKSAK
jgi:cytochrome c